LIDNDTNNLEDVFIQDTLIQVTKRVSIASDFTQGNGISNFRVISGDGRYVAFQSTATNLVTGDTNSVRDVFIRDLILEITSRVSVASGGDQGNLSTDQLPTLSYDGRYVAFQSMASNLVSNDTNGAWDVFVHDRISGSTTRVSVNSDGIQGDGSSGYPSISSDGRFIAFQSVANNLVLDDTNNTGDIFLHDRGLGVIAPQRPIILLPGMGASANWLCFLFEQSCDDPNMWNWMPTAEDVYEILINNLEQADYTRANYYLSVFFYDWRRPLAENAESLRDHISAVRSVTGVDQVDLIGHSMGGLVSRAYIQSNMYNYDVTHLITLGSPHMGSAKSYPYWEVAYFYQVGTVESIGFNILMRRWLPFWQSLPPVLAMRDIIPSFRDILYLSDYLYDEEIGDQVIPEADMIHRNENLAALFDNLDVLFERTDVSTFAGQSVITTERFFVHTPAWWLWPNWDDGEPNWDRDDEFASSFGDGTVLASSALLPDSAHIYAFVGVDHGGLPNNSDVIDTIFETLGIPTPLLDTAPALITESSNVYLILAMDGNIQTTITDSLGQVVGPGSRKPFSNHLYNNSCEL
jgi:pimeloyl-ACP methyl ester carboxylesterase